MFRYRYQKNSEAYLARLKTAQQKSTSESLDLEETELNAVMNKQPSARMVPVDEKRETFHKTAVGCLSSLLGLNVNPWK